jgi:hypothetical protein
MTFYLVTVTILEAYANYEQLGQASIFSFAAALSEVTQIHRYTIKMGALFASEEKPDYFVFRV